MAGLSEAFSFSGRTKRTAFLRFVPFAILLWMLAAWVDETLIAPRLCEINADWTCYLPGEVREGITFDMAVAFLLMIPLFSIFVRRMHSHERSGLWALLAIPFLVCVFAFYYDFGFEVSWPVFIASIAGISPLLFWMLKKGVK